MKTLLNSLFIFFLFTLFSCEKKTIIIVEPSPANHCENIDPFILNNYSKDAKNLYFSEVIADNNHDNYNNLVLNADEISSILHIIQAVYCMKIPEVDTIFNLYNIHGYHCYSYNTISLRVKTSFPEIQNLANNIFPTGNESLDSILLPHNFDSVKTAYSYPNFPWLTLHTSNQYNMLPFEKMFADLPQIEVAEIDKGCVGDGNNITLSRNPNSSTIIFSIGEGDCPAGCIYHRYWEFEVSNGLTCFKGAY